MALPPDNQPEPMQPGGKLPLSAVAVACLPVLGLTLGIPFANRLEPRVFGLPFLLAWIVAWIILTPVCMAVVHRLDRRHRR